MANEMKSSNAVMDVVRNYMEERCAKRPYPRYQVCKSGEIIGKAVPELCGSRGAERVGDFLALLFMGSGR